MMTATQTNASSHSQSAVKIVAIHDPSFDEIEAQHHYGWATRPDLGSFRQSFLPDEVTKDLARRMHYAAYRFQQAPDSRTSNLWKQRYFHLRDQIVLGNRKLIFRAVQRQVQHLNCCDDYVGECDIVLIRAVAAFNPWMGIRFSTYAFTCLIRALSRLSMRTAADRLLKATPLHDLAAAASDSEEDSSSLPWQRLSEFFRQGHPLLSDREKTILSRRFCHQQRSDQPSLEEVGRDLGISKERVRQVQASALVKLRHALVGDEIV